MTLAFAAPDSNAIPLHLLAEDEVQPWLDSQSEAVGAWVTGNG